jgi:CheY-specific phosphatase CheX
LKDSKHALIVVANRAVSSPVKDGLTKLGWRVTLAETSAALKEAVANAKDYSMALLALRLKSDDAAKVLSFMLKTLPATTKLFVSHDYLDAAALERLSKTGKLVAVDVADAEALVRRLTSAPVPRGKAPPPKFDTNLINCFISSVDDVLEYYVGEKPDHDKPTVTVGSKVPAGFITSLVTFVGAKEHCTASLTCAKAFIVDVASRVNGMPKADVEKDQEAIVGTVEELTDQIFHKAEILMGKIGYEFKMGEIEIRMEETAEPTGTPSVPMMVIPFRMADKKFFIGFSIQSS